MLVPAAGLAKAAFDLRAFLAGRIFHQVDLARGRGSVAHRCAGDHYEGRYVVAGEDRWATLWRVSGPRKRFTMITRYLRLR